MQAVPFETSHIPWFGPKQRARELLAARQHVLVPEDAMTAMALVLGQHWSAIQGIRFIDYVHGSKSPFRFTIALVWTYANGQARQAVYDQAAEVVRVTGWYPLVQGERMGSRHRHQQFASRLQGGVTALGTIEGSMQTLESAVSAEGGCSIRVRFMKGSLLLDTGLPDQLQCEDSDELVLLSHFHQDHAGGIISGRIGDRPVILSRVTAQILNDYGRLPVGKLRHQALVLDYNQPVSVSPNLTIEAFQVPHCPGAVGFEVSDNHTTLIFSGDLSIQTARHNYLPTLQNRVRKSRTPACCVLVDATMAGRPFGASRTSAAASLFSQVSNCTDVVLVAQDAEQLLYAYLDLFAYSRTQPQFRNTTAFLLSARLLPIFQLLHAAYINRELDQLDPFVAAQYGVSMVAWAESRWLYWLTRLPVENIPIENLRIWCVGEDELMYLPALDHAAVIRVGRGADKEVLTNQLTTLQVDSSAWTLHSDAPSLETTIKTLNSIAQVVLFHNFPKRLSKFVKDHGLTCQVLTRDPLRL